MPEASHRNQPPPGCCQGKAPAELTGAGTQAGDSREANAQRKDKVTSAAAVPTLMLLRQGEGEQKACYRSLEQQGAMCPRRNEAARRCASSSGIGKRLTLDVLPHCWDERVSAPTSATTQFDPKGPQPGRRPCWWSSPILRTRFLVLGRGDRLCSALLCRSSETFCPQLVELTVSMQKRLVPRYRSHACSKVVTTFGQIKLMASSS